MTAWVLIAAAAFAAGVLVGALIQYHHQARDLEEAFLAAEEAREQQYQLEDELTRRQADAEAWQDRALAAENELDARLDAL